MRRFSVMAFLAVFGLAFAPTVSHALNHAQGSSAFNEICTPEGMQQMAADSADQGEHSSAPSLNHLEHCPLCGLAACGLVTPSAPSTLAEPANLRHLQPALFWHAPRPLYAWASDRARAPPRLS